MSQAQGTERTTPCGPRRPPQPAQGRRGLPDSLSRQAFAARRRPCSPSSTFSLSSCTCDARASALSTPHDALLTRPRHACVCAWNSMQRHGPLVQPPALTLLVCSVCGQREATGSGWIYRRAGAAPSARQSGAWLSVAQARAAPRVPTRPRAAPSGCRRLRAGSRAAAAGLQTAEAPATDSKR